MSKLLEPTHAIHQGEFGMNIVIVTDSSTGTTAKAAEVMGKIEVKKVHK